MTPLGQLLRQRIAANGPITIADYMAECLMHPEHGYYSTRDPFGASGDFTTAPEISQMFGELLGLCLAQAWLDQGAPPRFVLAELGPGRGTLMADILRATRAVPGFTSAAQVHLVEASATLQARQRQTLGDSPVTWVDRVEALPNAPLFLVANEFFDALPIRQFSRTDKGWAEHLIAAGETGLQLGRGHASRLAALEPRWATTQPGDVIETCAPATAIAAEIGQRIARHGGAALFIDYGGWNGTGDTWQALRHHKPVGPLETPGDADLTAHVDFAPLAQALRSAGASSSRLTPQGVFLEKLGITARAQALARKLSGPALEAHIAAHRRFTHPAEMGTLFKVLGATAPSAPPLPGLEE
jgi:SAM-dependent MidA family methyltransferase